jgi:tetratricopeptide repeat protein
MRRSRTFIGRALGAAARFVASRVSLTRGRFRLVRGDVSGAVSSLESATRIAPETFEAWLHLARAHLRANDLLRARRAIARARETSPFRFAREMARWVRREGFELATLTDLGGGGAPASAPVPDHRGERETAVLGVRERHAEASSLPFGDCKDLDEYARFRSMPPISSSERETIDWDEVSEDLQDG